MNPAVEWGVWLLQLLVGFLAGCGIGYQAARLLFAARLSEMLLIAVAGGLICGAFTSFCGNRAWMARSIFLAPEPEPPRQARACSVVIGGAGAALALLTLIHHFIAAFDRQHDSSPGSLHYFLLPIAALPGFLLVRALRTGNGLWTLGTIDREETPLIFWVYVIFAGVVTFSVISMVLWT
jgi:hypothetical protein